MKIGHIPRNCVCIQFVQSFFDAAAMPDDYAGSMIEWYQIAMTRDESEALELPERADERAAAWKS